MAFYQKYRAKNFSEMIGQEHVIGTILQSIKADKLVHAYLLTGPRGIGKTSTARLLAKAINCETIAADMKAGKDTTGEPCNTCDSCLEIASGRSIDVLEIDAASHTGVEDIRDLIEKARMAPTKSAKKVYIIDEVHMLSKSAFNALLKTLEEPPAHVVFIMATTEVHKIPATILSRAQRFDFKRAEKKDVIANLANIVKSEKIDIDAESLELIAVAANGGHRDAVGLLEQVSSVENKITIDITKKILGIAESVEVYKFVGAIFNNFPEEGLKIAHELFDKGYDLGEFLKSIIEKTRQVILMQVSGEMFIEDTAENINKIKELSKSVSQTEALEVLMIFIGSLSLMKETNNPLLPIEIAVVKACKALGGTISPETNKVPEVKVAPVEKPASAPEKIVEVKTEPMIAQKPVPEIKNEEISIDDIVLDEEVEIAPAKVTEKAAVKAAEETDDVPVPVLEMTKDIWQQIVDTTKRENSTLAALLRDARPAQVTKNRLTLGVKFKFHKDKISEAQNTAILEKIVCDVTGCTYTIGCEIDSEKKPALSTAPAGDLEKAVTEVFEV
ncbi:MAG: DNA polymerase III subunit gamma/tau [Candidatus Berkelbacteria bacterium]